MKRAICFVLVLCLAVSVCSCIGIGDGAIYGDRPEGTRETAYNETVGEEITFPTEIETHSEMIEMPTIVSDPKATVSHFAMGGELTRKTELGLGALDDVMDILNSAERKKTSDILPEGAYFYMEVFDEGVYEKHYIYSNDAYWQGTAEGDQIFIGYEGHIAGAYDKLVAYFGIDPTADEVTYPPVDLEALYCYIDGSEPALNGYEKVGGILTRDEAFEVYKRLRDNAYVSDFVNMKQDPNHYLTLKFVYRDFASSVPLPDTDDFRFADEVYYRIEADDRVFQMSNRTDMPYCLYIGIFEGLYEQMRNNCSAAE